VSVNHVSEANYRIMQSTMFINRW